MKHEEDRLQSEVVKYLDLELRNCGGFVFHVPNGGKRTAMEAIFLKKSGVKPGVADLIILLPNAKTVFIEMKTKTGKQSEHQKEFEDIVSKLGFDYEVWRTIDDAIAWVKKAKSKNWLISK